MITIEHVSKRRGSSQILSDISFEARPGRVTGFLGPNGAGKSSTLRILLGLDRAQEGTAHICGRPFASLAMSAIMGPGFSPIGAKIRGFPRQPLSIVIPAKAGIHMWTAPGSQESEWL